MEGSPQPPFLQNTRKTMQVLLHRFAYEQKIMSIRRKTIGVGHKNCENCMENDRGTNLQQFLFASGSSGNDRGLSSENIPMSTTCCNLLGKR